MNMKDKIAGIIEDNHVGELNRERVDLDSAADAIIIITALPDYEAQQARIEELEVALLTIKDWEAGPSGKTFAEMYMRAVACEALKETT